MKRIMIGSCLQVPLVLVLSILLQSIIPGLADDSSSSSGSSRTFVGTKILIVCLGVAIIGFSVLLFKMWQKKKREEQHARLLKLFEDDDELEVELGIRD